MLAEDSSLLNTVERLANMLLKLHSFEYIYPFDKGMKLLSPFHFIKASDRFISENPFLCQLLLGAYSIR